MFLEKVPILAMAMVLTGCVESFTVQEPLPKGAVAPDAWTRIEVIDIDNINRPYEIVGFVRGDAILDNARSLKKKAARLDGDAITLPENLGGGWIGSSVIAYR